MCAWPSSSARTKNWSTEILTDGDLEGQLDILHSYFNDSLNASTGHAHTGGTADGPKITLTTGVQGTLPVANGGTGLTSLASLYALIYPVGSVYINASDSTSPATLFGFGTWSALGAGKVIVGIDSGDTDFDTIGETGGSKTSAHTHTISRDGYGVLQFGSGASEGMIGAASNQGNDYSAQAINTATLTSSSSAPSVVQPYVVCYVWKRTA